MVHPTAEGQPPGSRETLKSSVRSATRWFAAEFLVVVTGVLAALGVQAWYQARQDAGAEGRYLAQLESDLEVSQEMLRNAIAEDSMRLDANTKLITALRSAEAPPDSSWLWLRHRLGFYSDPRPVLGTVNTLIQTGDIGLIRNVQLPSQVVAYASQMAMDIDELGRNAVRLIQANDAERMQWEMNGLRPFEATRTPSAVFSSGIHSDEDAVRFQAVYLQAWTVLRADPELRAALSVRRSAFSNRLLYLQRMAASTNELHQLVAQRNASE
jgi:hypothetical protein